MTNPNPSPLSFLPVMLAAWRVLCDAEFPLSLTGVEMRLVPELNWLALDQPARQLLEKALRALTALELVEQRGANFTRLGERAPDENRMSREMRDFLTCNICGEINCACGWNLDDEQPYEESTEDALEASA